MFDWFWKWWMAGNPDTVKPAPVDSAVVDESDIPCLHRVHLFQDDHYATEFTTAADYLRMTCRKCGEQWSLSLAGQFYHRIDERDGCPKCKRAAVTLKQRERDQWRAERDAILDESKQEA